MTFSDFGRLSLRDLGRGLLVSVGSAIYPTIKDIMHAGRLPTQAEWVSIGGIALSATAGYLSVKVLSGVPKEIQVDTSKTVVVDKHTKEVLSPNTTAETVKISE